MNKSLIIGISGKLGSGKDTLGAFIEKTAREQNFIVYRRGFGDALKEEVAEFLTRYSYTEIMDFLDTHCKNDDLFDEITEQTFAAPPRGWWQELRAKFGQTYTWDYRGLDAALIEAQMHNRMYKERYRALMQWWGTEYRREQFDQNYWLRRLEEYIESRMHRHAHLDRSLLFYVPDVRYINEVEFVQKHLEGYVIRIIRPGHEPTTSHKSEHALNNYKGFNLTVINDKTLKDLANVGTVAFLNACSWKWGNAGDAA